MSAAKIFKSSINVKTLGSPMKLVAMTDMKPGDRGLLGTIYGVANGIVKRADPKDPEKFFNGLKGTFEALPADGCDAVGGANLFAPDTIHDKVVDQMKRGANSVSFAFEAYVVAGGTAGFTWEYRFLSEGEPEEEDMLASVRALVRPKTVPVLAGQAEPPQVDEVKGKGKGKAD